MITDSIRYVGVDDPSAEIFEGMYRVPNGMAYNSYVIVDEKIAVMDTVAEGFYTQWMTSIREGIADRVPDYLVVQHMEPDHSANVARFLEAYPECRVVATLGAFGMMKNYFRTDYADRRIVVRDGDSLSLGAHELTFVTAPMVHWPEVMMTYDTTDKVLFSADAFGKFGTLDVEEDWACEARRYYFGIVGKYGAQVQNVLNKLAPFEIATVCPLHGPILRENIDYYMRLYCTWSSYKPETEGVLIAYTSVYGNTKYAVELLRDKLLSHGVTVTVTDLATSDMSEAVEDAFRYSKLVLATTTYNGEVFPYMREFLHKLVERNFAYRRIGIIENGSWAPIAGKVMTETLSTLKGIEYCETNVKIFATVKDENLAQIDKLARELL